MNKPIKTKEDVVLAYMGALGEEILSEETWKKIADANRDILESDLIEAVPPSCFLEDDDIPV